MYDLRAAESVTAVAILAVVLTGLLGGVFVGTVLAADVTDSPSPHAGGSSANVATLVPTVTDTPDILNTATPTPSGTTAGTSTPTATLTAAPAATPTSTDGPTLTATPDDTLSGVTNETENVTETVTNTTRTVTNTTGTVTNTTDGTVDEVTNTTETVTNTTETVTNTTDDTVDEVTNTTENVTEAATNATGDLAEETNLTVTVTAGVNVSVEAGSTPTGTDVSTDTPVPGDASTRTSTADSSSTGSTSAAGRTDSSANGGDDASTGATGRSATQSGTVVAPPGGRDGAAGSSPLGSTGGAVLGGALVVAGVIAAAASKHVAAATSVAQGQELAWLAKTVRFRAGTTMQLVKQQATQLPRFVLPIGYSRYDDSDPLEHETRESLFGAIERSPGVNLSSLADDADASLSSVRHHLRILDEENLVVSERIRGQRRYFLKNESDPALVAALDDTATEPILRTLAQSGPASVSDLAEDLGRDPSTISHHVSRLEEDGLVERERDGQSVQNSLAPVAERVLARGTPGQKRPVATE